MSGICIDRLARARPSWPPSSVIPRDPENNILTAVWRLVKKFIPKIPRARFVPAMRALSGLEQVWVVHFRVEPAAGARPESSHSRSLEIRRRLWHLAEDDVDQ